MRHSTLLTCCCWLSILGPSSAGLVQAVLKPGFRGTRGAVASESIICSQIGVDMIGMGGSAADAMVATELCVGVIGMYHSGIGGGGFMLVRDKHGRYEVIDYRETAPAAAHKNMYKNNPDASVLGGLAVAIPGELRGLEYLHTKYGALPWSTVVTPSVRVARDGFKVNEDLVRYMEGASKNNTFLMDDPVWAEDFSPNGTLVKLGDIITRKRYADSLEKIAKHGADIFYQGELAQSMIRLLSSTNGIITPDDLKNYTVSIKKPLSINYRDYRLFTTEAPSSGAVTLSILKTMEQYPLEDLTDKNLTTHRFVEAMKFAYGARQELGDPDFISNIEQYQKLMTSDAKAREVRGRIQDNQTQPINAYNPQELYAAESSGTSHIVTADSSGLTVSSTTTINLLFGAQIMTSDTGIILNNEMDDFSQPGRRNSFGFEPSPANFIAAGKRPLSSITPLMAEFAGNGTLLFAAGAAGGSRIISATTLIAWNVLQAGMGMGEAVAAPRLHDQLMPDVLLVEDGFDRAVFAALASRHHNATWMGPGASSAQAVMRLWNGTFDAASEPRQRNSGGLTV
ncbi:gamma-glutamyltranspeptidase [Lasiosphaeria miniovina]|uniref:Glutathione hydrolase n=1 Tax=Lasiosphaeria miniovina TaxID=1954250 RepID=A0AA39ZZI0_9PEZI|nr:gamma-glutamyltranspeptidase [Lasiosphaeria miniovina]KAK0706497.1 gamma-glutamyltranspeptidase [Lasiosphaeria miniovina]